MGPRCQEERFPHLEVVPTSRMRSDLVSASSHGRVHLLVDGEPRIACAWSYSGASADSRPSLNAVIKACARFWAPSFSYSFITCVFAVDELM